MTGLDIHKPDTPETGRDGRARGTPGPRCRFEWSTLGINFTLDGSGSPLAGAASTFVLVGLVGVADDVVGLRQKLKPFLIVVASIPLMSCLLGRGSIFIPVIGSIHLALLYPLIAVPLAITTSANFSNLLGDSTGSKQGARRFPWARWLSCQTSRDIRCRGAGVHSNLRIHRVPRAELVPSEDIPRRHGQPAGGSWSGCSGPGRRPRVRCHSPEHPSRHRFHAQDDFQEPLAGRHVYGNTHGQSGDPETTRLSGSRARFHRRGRLLRKG